MTATEVTSTVPSVTVVPLTRLVRVELHKTVDTRSGRWLLAAIGVAVAAVVVVRLLTADAGDLAFGDLVDATSTPLSLVLPLLAILSVTTEWTQHTALATFTLEPRRSRVVLAKLAAVLSVGLLAVATALATAAVGTLAGGLLRDGAGSWDFAPTDLWDLAIAQVLAVVQAFAFGLLLTNTAAAIVLYYLLTPVWGAALSLADELQSAAPWVDLTTALVPLTSGDGVSPLLWAQVATATTLWVLLPLAGGVVRLLRREIRPA